MAEIGRIADVTEPPTMNRSHLRPNAPILSAAAAWSPPVDCCWTAGKGSF